MFTDILLLLVGLALITFASDWLVDGSSAIARKSGMSEFVIGMTIVGIGTSMPELVSSLFSAFEGHGDMAIGNVTGSNICNTLLILGVTALISPLAYPRNNIRRDIPICIAATGLVSIMIYSWFTSRTPIGLNRLDGVILLVLWILFMIYSFRTGKADPATSSNCEKEPVKEMSTFRAILLCVLGIGGLVIGGHLFVDKAIDVAKEIGVSDAFIAVTLMAFGTSVPELATCIVAAAKKKNDLALGNIIGSNISNILLILGATASITPLCVVTLTQVDMGLFILSSVFLLTAAWFFRKKVLDRGDAVLYLILYGAYMVWLVSIQ